MFQSRRQIVGDVNPSRIIIEPGPPGERGDPGPTGNKGPDGPAGIRGPTGPAGPPGKDGIDGKDGADGRPGRNGANGVKGNPGKNGANGRDGINGLNGKNGINGKDGAMGPPGKNGLNGRNGAKGEKGVPGKNGTNGRNGINGLPGKNGINGTNGKKGEKGDPGLNGEKGDKGDPGPNGIDGINGTDGTDGLPGPDGLPGADGTNGIDGVDGLPGANGRPGRNGAKGLPGKNGIDGTDGKPGAKGPKGAKGPDGPIVFTGQETRNTVENVTNFPALPSNIISTPLIDVGVDGIRVGNTTVSSTSCSGEFYAYTSVTMTGDAVIGSTVDIPYIIKGSAIEIHTNNLAHILALVALSSIEEVHVYLTGDLGVEDAILPRHYRFLTKTLKIIGTGSTLVPNLWKLAIANLVFESVDFQGSIDQSLQIKHINESSITFRGCSVSSNWIAPLLSLDSTKTHRIIVENTTLNGYYSISGTYISMKNVTFTELFVNVDVFDTRSVVFLENVSGSRLVVNAYTLSLQGSSSRVDLLEAEAMKTASIDGISGSTMILSGYEYANLYSIRNCRFYANSLSNTAAILLSSKYTSITNCTFNDSDGTPPVSGSDYGSLYGVANSHSSSSIRVIFDSCRFNKYYKWNGSMHVATDSISFNPVRTTAKETNSMYF